MHYIERTRRASIHKMLHLNLVVFYIRNDSTDRPVVQLTITNTITCYTIANGDCG